MTPERVAEGVTLHVGDCLDVLASLPDASVAAVVTDPPYGLADHPVKRIEQALTAWLAGDRSHVPDGRGFMGREWDKFVPPPAAWDECYRVLKPGGHLLAFAAPRTYDLMGISIRLAGFDVFDSIDWINGQGFPKSLNVSKAIDRRREDRAGSFKRMLADAVAASGKTRQQINAECGFTMRFDVPYEKDPGCWGSSLPTLEQFDIICQVLGIEHDYRREQHRADLVTTYKVIGHEDRANSPSGLVSCGRESTPVRRELTAPGTEDAARWEGWGTALKPSHEPIVLAVKPLDGTYAANVLEHGTGALNIGGCVVEGPAGSGHWVRNGEMGTRGIFGAGGQAGEDFGRENPAAGRWPPNILLSEEAAEEMDRQSGVLTSGANTVKRSSGKGRGAQSASIGAESRPDGTPMIFYGDTGGASRFFPVFRYQAKAPASERPRLPDGTAWPTVKPLDLMRWLVRLVTPPGGTVLDLFAGTGTTGEACLLEGFPCVLIEKDPVAVELIRIRLGKPAQPDLFTLAPAGQQQGGNTGD